MKTVELKDETWFEFQEACRWHKETQYIPCKHTCSKDHGNTVTVCVING